MIIIFNTPDKPTAVQVVSFALRLTEVTTHDSNELLLKLFLFDDEIGEVELPEHIFDGSIYSTTFQVENDSPHWETITLKEVLNRIHESK